MTYIINSDSVRATALSVEDSISSSATLDIFKMVSATLLFEPQQYNLSWAQTNHIADSERLLSAHSSGKYRPISNSFLLHNFPATYCICLQYQSALHTSVDGRCESTV